MHKASCALATKWFETEYVISEEIELITSYYEYYSFERTKQINVIRFAVRFLTGSEFKSY